MLLEFIPFLTQHVRNQTERLGALWDDGELQASNTNPRPDQELAIGQNAA